MMKTKLATLIFILALGIGSASAQALFAERISTPDGSINFVVGFSPESAQQVTRNDNSVYTTAKLVLINDEKASDFDWDDYKVMVLTKNGDLFYNYTTSAETGEYACKYTLKPGESKTQLACFAKTFKAADVERVWLSFSDNISFELVYAP